MPTEWLWQLGMYNYQITGWKNENAGFDSRSEERKFLLQVMPTVPDFHIAYCPMGTVGSFLKAKRVGRGGNHSRLI